MNDELVLKATKLIESSDNLTDADIAKQLSTNKQKVSRSAVFRLRKKLKINVKTFLDRLSPDERDIYLDYVAQKIQEDEPKKNWITRLFPIRRTAADPPITTFDGQEMPTIHEHENFLNHYNPQNDIQPIDVTLDNNNEIISQSPFTAKSAKDSKVTYPRFFYNQYTALDYILYQNIWMTTVCGSVIDILTAFTMGRGIRPVLKLNKKPIEKDLKTINGVQETKDQAEARLIEDNQKLLEPIIAIDKSFSDPEQKDPYLDEDFNTKIEALIRNHWIFGRCMLLKESFSEYTFKWEGVKYPKIPNVLKVIHPRDMGFIQIDQPTLKLKGVQLNYSTSMIPATDVLYLEHNADSPIYLGKYFGYSKMQRMQGHGRSLRKLIDKDFPNVSSIGYAGFPIIAFKRDEKGTTNESTQNQTFANTLTVGQVNTLSLKDPENDMHIHQVDTNPKISEMIELAHYHAEACAKIGEVPTSLVAKEKDPNRDTLLGILRLFIENVIKRHRATIGQKIAAQHYMPNFRIIHADNKKALETFHIEAEFDDFKLESWVDIVDSTVTLNQLYKLKADANGELLGIPNLESKIDQKAEALAQSEKFTDVDGNTMEIKTNKSKKAKEPKKPLEPKDK